MNLRRMHNNIHREVDLTGGVWSDKPAPSVLLKYGESFKLTGDKFEYTMEGSRYTSTPDMRYGHYLTGRSTLNITHVSDEPILRGIMDIGQTIDIIMIANPKKVKPAIIQECTMTNVDTYIDEHGTTLCVVDFISNNSPKNIDIDI